MFDSLDFNEFTVGDITIDQIDTVIINCNSGVATERESHFAALLLLLDYIYEDCDDTNERLHRSNEYYSLVAAHESELGR
jgi:hypothetical protein